MAIAKAAGVTGRAVREGLRAARPLFGRSEILRLPAGEGGGITVIRDCYNANPASVAAAVAFADALQWPGRRIYVIGSMLELGEATAAAHEELGRILAASRADRVFFFGEETAAARDVYGASRPGAFYAASIGELSRALAELVRGGDLLLLKGSRLCALERVLDALPGGNAETAEARA
jgi:UDP-N-acetylmuramoyl-tripeptide--D-alanyl-D-alanine ligase